MKREDATSLRCSPTVQRGLEPQLEVGCNRKAVGNGRLGQKR